MNFDEVEARALESAKGIVDMKDSPFMDDSTMIAWIKNAIIEAAKSMHFKVCQEHEEYYRKHIKPKLTPQYPDDWKVPDRSKPRNFDPERI